MERPKLGIVIPAYNEASRIQPTLASIQDYLARQPYTWRVMVVSDGSSDATANLVRQFADGRPGFEVLEYQPNRGKGYAVRTGMLALEAEWLLLSDADLATPIDEVEKLFAANAHIAIGSRPLRDSDLVVRQPLYRELLGRAFNLVVQLLAIRGIADTQCGFKLFRLHEARDIFSRCKTDGFGFDFEALMIARDLGYRIAEVPIRWSHQEGSKVVLMRDGPKMLADLVRLRLAGRRRRLEPRAD